MGMQLTPQQRDAFGSNFETFVLVQSILSRLPVVFCCNYVKCRKMDGTSEVGSVVGRNKGCQRCTAALHCQQAINARKRLGPSMQQHMFVCLSGCIYLSVVESFAWFLYISSPW